MTIGKFATNLMVSTNMSNEEILKQIRIKYPECKTQMNSIYWYRSKLNVNKNSTKSKQKEQDGRWIFVPNQGELNF